MFENQNLDINITARPHSIVTRHSFGLSCKQILIYKKKKEGFSVEAIDLLTSTCWSSYEVAAHEMKSLQML